MFPLTKCTHRAIRRKAVSVLMPSGRQERVFYWPGRVRSGSGTDCEQRYWSLVATSFHNSENLTKISNFFWTASHSFYSLASTKNDIKYSLPCGLHKSWAVRTLIWSHPESGGGARHQPSPHSQVPVQSQTTPDQPWSSCSTVNFFCLQAPRSPEPQWTSPITFKFQLTQHLETSGLFEETW